jgi:hypothetical protein
MRYVGLRGFGLTRPQYSKSSRKFCKSDKPSQLVERHECGLKRHWQRQPDRLIHSITQFLTSLCYVSWYFFASSLVDVIHSLSVLDFRASQFVRIVIVHVSMYKDALSADFGEQHAQLAYQNP